MGTFDSERHSQDRELCDSSAPYAVKPFLASEEGPPSALLPRLGHRLQAALDIFRDTFQMFACRLRSCRDLLDVGESVRIIGQLTKLFEVGLDFGEDKEHLAA